MEKQEHQFNGKSQCMWVACYLNTTVWRRTMATSLPVTQIKKSEAAH